jgi:hypothetical protein
MVESPMQLWDFKVKPIPVYDSGMSCTRKQQCRNPKNVGTTSKFYTTPYKI